MIDVYKKLSFLGFRLLEYDSSWAAETWYLDDFDIWVAVALIGDIEKLKQTIIIQSRTTDFDFMSQLMICKGWAYQEKIDEANAGEDW